MQKVNVDVLIWNELRSNDRFGFSSSATCRFLNYRLTTHSQTTLAQKLRKGSEVILKIVLSAEDLYRD